MMKARLVVTDTNGNSMTDSIQISKWSPASGGKSYCQDKMDFRVRQTGVLYQLAILTDTSDMVQPFPNGGYYVTAGDSFTLTNLSLSFS